MLQPLISIIIPTFNRAEDLKRALQSIVIQTVSDWEVIIIDNNSTDHTDEVINSFREPKFKLFKISNNGLITISRNYGISVSNGKYIAFLDSDDWWLPNKLEISLFYLNKGFDFVYHPLYIVKKYNNIKHHFFYKKIGNRKLTKVIFDDLIKNGNAISNSSVVVKKSLINQYWPLPQEKFLNPICDYHWWLTISKNSDNFHFINKTLGYYWYGGGNTYIPKNIINSLRKLVEIYDQNFKEQLPPWLTFSLGKSYYVLKNYLEAKYYFSQTIKNGSISLKAKSFLFFLIILFKKNDERK